jgi:hypothetical protein
MCDVRSALLSTAGVLSDKPVGCGAGNQVSHRARGEVAYPAAGEVVVRCRFAGFVPTFCPDALARLMRFLVPLAERLPLVNAQCRLVYVMVVERHGRD